ncbi:MAG: hypothetical protein WCJ74_01460 [bacterium]
MEDKPQTQKQTPTQNQPASQEPSRISKTDFGLMLATAIFFDVVLAAIQLIPFAGSAAAMSFNTVPLMIFFIWYKLKGINFSNPKRAFSFFGTAIIEFIPVINALPTWTAEVIYMYTLENKDKILSVAGKATKVAAVASFGAKVASVIPATAPVGRALGEVAHQASRVAEQAEMVHGLRKNNSVGNEIRPKIDKNVKDVNNIVKLPTAEKIEPSNIVPFPEEEKIIPFNRDTTSEKRKVA